MLAVPGKDALWRLPQKGEPDCTIVEWRIRPTRL